LSAIHDEALSISDAIDQAYGEHVAGKDAEIERLRARSTKFDQLLSEALRQGWLDESKTSPSWLQEALAAVAKWLKEQANFAVDIRTCGKPELDALNDRAKVWREQHSPNPERPVGQTAAGPAGAGERSKHAFTNWPTSSLFGWTNDQIETAKREANELAARQVFEREPGTGRNPPAARNLLQWDACDSFL
jgi:hypothetical protein